MRCFIQSSYRIDQAWWYFKLNSDSSLLAVEVRHGSHILDFGINPIELHIGLKMKIIK